MLKIRNSAASYGAMPCQGVIFQRGMPMIVHQRRKARLIDRFESVGGWFGIGVLMGFNVWAMLKMFFGM